MPAYHPEPDELDDGINQPPFEKLKKQTDRPGGIKQERRQRSKEWGRAVSRTMRERRRDDPTSKP